MDTTNVGPAIGLILICIGFLLQIIYSWSGRREIRKRTLIFYNLGVAVLVINSVFVAKKFDSILILNFVSLILGSILLMRISKYEVKQGNNQRARKRRR